MIINTRTHLVIILSIIAFSFGNTAFASEPVVSTLLPTAISTSGATLNGNLISEGGSLITATGFQYGENTNYNFVASSPVPNFQYNFQFGVGGFGMQEGTFNQPTGIAINEITGKIYVIEQNGSSSRVQKFSSTGVFESQFGGVGYENGEFDTTGGIAINSEGILYVTDVANNRIQAFDGSGNYLFQFGTFGFEPGELYYPYGIDIDDEGYIYVADTYNHRVQKFDANGNYVLSFGSQGFADGQFNLPISISVDQEGSTYVGDHTYRVQKFDANGNFILDFGGPGSEEGEINVPVGVHADDYGSVFVADMNNSRVQVFSQSGDYVAEFGVHDPDQALPSHFFNVGGITTDNRGNVYVSDLNHNRIQKFSRKFSTNISGLKCGKTYNYRAFATNLDGTSYGTNIGFSTIPCSITTRPVDTVGPVVIKPAVAKPSLKASVTQTKIKE